MDDTVSVQQKSDIEDVVQLLIGAVPHTNLTLSELREEKLEKYERPYP